MDTAIVTINYNGGEKLKHTLESLYKNTTEKFDMYIVDNGSEDGSREFIREKYPQIKVLEVGENIGFGKGHNVFFEEIFGDANKHDKPSTYAFIALVNPDMELKEGWLGQLKKTILQDKKIAAVDPKIIYMDRFDVINVETTNPQVYFYHEDYRFMSRIVGDPGIKTKEISLGNQQFIQPNITKFPIYLDTKLEKLKFAVYDESMLGFELNIGGVIVRSNQLITKIKKVLFKLGLLGVSAKVQKFSISREKLDFIAKNKEVVNSLGSEIRQGEVLPDNCYFGKFAEETPSKEFETELFHAACVLIRSDVIRKVGYYDPNFFMFYEESDWGLRMKKEGYKIMADPNSVVYHFERGSRSDKTIEFMTESQKYFIKKWGSS